jgi:transposase
MIPVPTGVRIWLAVGHTDMRRGMHSLGLQVQQVLGRDPHAGDLYVFRGRKADLVKIIWHDGVGMSLYMKRLERGRFIWPSPAWRSPARSSPTCWTESIGETRDAHGGQKSPDSVARGCVPATWLTRLVIRSTA